VSSIIGSIVTRRARGFHQRVAVKQAVESHDRLEVHQIAAVNAHEAHRIEPRLEIGEAVADHVLAAGLEHAHVLALGG
jgi:hypothetical protein